MHIPILGCPSKLHYIVRIVSGCDVGDSDGNKVRMLLPSIYSDFTIAAWLYHFTTATLSWSGLLLFHASALDSYFEQSSVKPYPRSQCHNNMRELSPHPWSSSHLAHSHIQQLASYLLAPCVEHKPAGSNKPFWRKKQIRPDFPLNCSTCFTMIYQRGYPTYANLAGYT